MNTTRLLLCLALCTTLFACNSGKQFASSFGKRRYTKGYYVFSAGTGKSVNPPTENKIAAKPKNNGILQTELTETNKAKTIPLNNLALNTVVRNIAKQAFFAERSLLFIKPFGKLLQSTNGLATIQTDDKQEDAQKSKKYILGSVLTFVGLLGALIIGVILLVNINSVSSVTNTLCLILIFAFLCLFVFGLTMQNANKPVPAISVQGQQISHPEPENVGATIGGTALVLIGGFGLLLGGFITYFAIILQALPLLIFSIPILIISLILIFAGYNIVDKSEHHKS